MKAEWEWKKATTQSNRLDYRIDFRDIFTIIFGLTCALVSRKNVIFDFCCYSIDNIFSIFGEYAKFNVRWKKKRLSPLTPTVVAFASLCALYMWIRAARRLAFHASSFPKSLIFRMVFVLQNVKFMLLLAEKKRANERQMKKNTERTQLGMEKRKNGENTTPFTFRRVVLCVLFRFVFQSTNTSTKSTLRNEIVFLMNF